MQGTVHTHKLYFKHHGSEASDLLVQCHMVNTQQELGYIRFFLLPSYSLTGIHII